MCCNKKVKKLLVQEYGPICFLGGTIDEKNLLTCHHIVSLNQGGESSIDNLALVARLEHDMIHLITRYQPQTAKEINEYLVYFKKTRDMLKQACMHSLVLATIEDLDFKIVEKSKCFVLRPKNDLFWYDGCQNYSYENK